MTPEIQSNSDMPAIYKRHRICLWVEDLETKAYFQQAWFGQDIGLLISGPSDVTRAVAESAWRAGYEHVFSLVDRDFGKSNRKQWKTPGSDLRTYRLESFELENLVLDTEALEKSQFNSQKRTRQEIETKIQEGAEAQIAWMAFRSCLAELRAAWLGEFPEHGPPERIRNEQEAVDFISEWYRSR